MVVAPSATPVETPADETVATVVADEVHVALEVTFPWVLFE
jgi:hypothetical protein